MIKSNFKKMYLISEEKFQVLNKPTNMENLLDSGGTISNDSSTSKTVLDNTQKKPNESLINSQIHSHNNSTSVQNNDLEMCKCNKKEQSIINNHTTDKSTQTGTTLLKPFRKMFTRKYKFKERTPKTRKLIYGKKRKSYEIDLKNKDIKFPPTKRKRYTKDNISNSSTHTDSLVKSARKSNWIKLH